MKKTICSLLLLAFLSGCAATTKDIEAFRNRDKLSTLSIGMKQEEVLEHMGKPWKKEAFMKSEKAYAILYYVTQRIPDGTTTDEEMTPVVFREGILIGWGRRFFSDFRIEVNQSADY